MNKKKSAVILLLIIVISFVAGNYAFRTFLGKENEKYVKNVEDGDVTRYEWMQMLCERVGMTEYEKEEPYFEDVEDDDPCFRYIQTAVEWEVLETSSDFDGNLPASGRFIALTAMKTIGQEKIQLYLAQQKEITENTYIKLAIKNGLIGKEQLENGFSEEECEQVLEALESLYFGEFWRDDYSNVVYQDDITVLSSKNVLQNDRDDSQIVVDKDVMEFLQEGEVIVYKDNNTKIKTAGKIEEISADGTVLLSPVKLDEVVKSLAVSDITELTFQDIINYYDLENSESMSVLPDYEHADETLMKTGFSFDAKSKGFKLILSVEEKNKKKHLTVRVSDHATGVAYKLPISIAVDPDSEYEAEVDVDKIAIGGQVIYKALGNNLKYADVALDAHATVNGKIKTDVEKKIPLLKTPVPLGNGIVGVDMQLNLMISAEGSISFEVEVPVQASVCYEKNKGLRNFKHNFSANDPEIKANCEAGAMVRFEPTLEVLGINVVDAEADIGMTVSASVERHSNAQVCTDVSASFPVITLSVCGDDEADTLLGAAGVSAEWEIVSAENARFHPKLHYEVLPDKTEQFVEKCTYKESKRGGRNTYRTRYTEVHGTDAPVFCFDYPDGWTITEEEVGDDDFFGENVVLTNERGVTVTYIKFETELGYEGRTMTEYQAEKVADVSFKIPDMAHLVVAKIKETGYLDMDIDSDFTRVDGDIFYAVLPKDEIEKYDGVYQSVGLLGYYDTFSFDYPTPYLFLAESPDWQFTEEEEVEAISILSSLRVEGQE